MRLLTPSMSVLLEYYDLIDSVIIRDSSLGGKDCRLAMAPCWNQSVLTMHFRGAFDATRNVSPKHDRPRPYWRRVVRAGNNFAHPTLTEHSSYGLDNYPVGWEYMFRIQGCEQCRNFADG